MRIILGLINFFILLTLFMSCTGKIEVKAKSKASFTSMYPSFVNANGGDTIVFTGENLSKVSSIKINDKNCSSLTKLSSTQISCVPPSNGGVAELADVSLVLFDKTITLTKALTYTLILGQPDSKTSGNLDLTFSSPNFAKVMAQKLFVTDFSNNRVLIWNSLPTTFNTHPDIIIGQANGRTTTENYPTLSASTLFGPAGVWSNGTKLAIADYSNNRVLLWNTFPTTSGQAADVVLGQPNFASNAINNGPNTVECGGVAGLNACSLSRPYGVIFEEDKLIVSDDNNQRLLIWNGWPAANQTPADNVVGQPSFLVNTPNNGPATAGCGPAGRNACSFSSPKYLTYHEGKLIVPDYNNNRVLIFNTIPTAYGTPADLVLGQTDFTTAATTGPATALCGGVAGNNPCSLRNPTGATTNGVQFYVSDYSNNRVLGWSTFPTANQQPADIVIGQNSFSTNAPNKGTATTLPSDSSLRTPQYVHLQDNYLIVADRTNNRVLKFTPLPASFASASLVLGHSSFNDALANYFQTFSDQMQRVSDAKYDGTHFIITDRLNNRIFIDSGLPNSLSDTTTRIVLGQPDFLSGHENSGPATAACGGVAGTNACSLNSPLSVLKVGTKLAATDFNNNRVLIWNTIPTTTQAPADLVLGQPNLTSATANNGPNTVACGSVLGINKCSLNGPIGLASDGTNLIVSDGSNNRILIWNTFPTVNQQPADVVLGQPGFTTVSINNGPNTPACDNSLGLNRCSLAKPFYMSVYNNKLIVADQNNNRLLIWNSIPSVNQTPADVVIGQSTFTTNAETTPSTASSVRLASGVCVTDSGRLVVSDQKNNRILVFNQIPSSNGERADVIIGQSNESEWVFDAGKTVNAENYNLPYAVSCYQENIVVSDYQNSRIKYFPLPPISP